jgi:hypothetical protein
MVKYYSKEVETKQDALEIFGDYLAGTLNNESACLDETDEDFAPLVKAFNITEDDLLQYLNDAGIIQCEGCGWWTYSGEGDGTYCDDCMCDQENDEDD